MQINDAMVAKAAQSDAEFDGRTWLAMPKSERKRYMGRSRRSLTAALAAMWRPIEEAPKDGTYVLIAGGTYYNSMSLFNEDYPFEGRTIAKWDDYHRQWRGENSGGHDEYLWHKPTAWQPLPAPPRGK